MEVEVETNVQEHSVVFSEKAKEDLRLVEQAKAGDQKAYARLLSKYRDTMFHMISRMVKNAHDAEDLTMESFGKAFRNIQFYKPERAFSTWLFKIATNGVIDFIRGKRLRMVSIDNDPDTDDNSSQSMGVPELIEKSDDPEERMIRDQKAEYMWQIVSQLHEDYREITIMRYFKEKSYTEISEELGIPIGTVKARLYRSRELLIATFKDFKVKKDRF
ncbi:MAG: sigma-70 family RNA polymerase sigma factor [Bacteroidales bacterium]|nr:sigma-70 family RNA polymerase sigma factor [Bacteroidales bacterium]